MTIAYLAHPVGERHFIDDVARYAQNIAAAHEWIAFLVAAIPGLTIECSWIALNTAFDPRFYGGRLVTSAHELLQVCHVLVLVGVRISPHMQQLVDWGRAVKLPVLDLTDLGERAPLDRDGAAARDIAARLRALGL